MISAPNAATDPSSPRPPLVGGRGLGSLFSKAATIAGDIKLAHSVFALPFALLAAFLAASTPAIAWPRFTLQLGLIVICMVTARTWAMVINRLADARLDAANPRTARRAFASGRAARADGLVACAVAAALFAGACSLFGLVLGNWWPLALSGPVLVWIAGYSWTKRFTWLCHAWLGVALALSPLCAAVAVGGLDAILTHAEARTIWALAAMVVLWVSGFDVIYALQDLDYDRSVGLRSVPARFGWRGAVWLSRLLHAGAAGALVVVWDHSPALGPVYLGGAIAAIALLVFEHLTLIRRGPAGLPMVFFTYNGLVSLVVGGVGIVDVLL